MRNLFVFFSLGLATFAVKAQEPVKMSSKVSQVALRPFLFSENTLTGQSPYWGLNYSGTYGESVAGPFGYDGLDQQLAVKGYIGKRYTLLASTTLGFARAGGVTSAQRAEIIRDFIGGKTVFGPRLGIGAGFSRDVHNVKAASSRITAALEALNWRLGGNLMFEKAFSRGRDNLDMISSIGFQHRIAGAVYVGVEAVGQDLEGFWEEEEAEGGAKLFMGPSININPASSKFGLSVAGGPVFYATKSPVISSATRDLSITSKNGYTLRAALTFNLQK